MPRDFTEDNATLVEVMAWSRQATGKKPLPEPMLTQDPDLCRHMAQLGHNEVNTLMNSMHTYSITAIRKLFPRGLKVGKPPCSLFLVGLHFHNDKPLCIDHGNMRQSFLQPEGSALIISV